MKQDRRLTHPLTGVNTSTLLRLLWRNRPIPVSSWPRLAPIALSALGRWPFRQVERILTMRRFLKATPMESPVFIVGHWRSGTTHLGNLLSRDPNLGSVPPVAAGLPWEMLTLGKLFRGVLEKKLPKSRLIDNVAVRPDSPQEDEFGLANMIPYSFLHAQYFPKHLERNLNEGVFWDGLGKRQIDEWKRRFVYFLSKVHLQQDRRQLVVRNPVYMARMTAIRELFPDARFVHIYRDPARVFQSMQNYYRKLLPALAFQKWDDEQVDEVIYSTYDRLMDRYREEAAELPSGALVEIRFEDLEADPLSILEQLYAQLGLGDFELALAPIKSYLDSLSRYEKNSYEEDPDAIGNVRERWSRHFAELGYAE